MAVIARDQGWTINVCWYCGRAEHAAVDPCDCAFDAPDTPKRMLSVAVRPADDRGAVSALRDIVATFEASEGKDFDPFDVSLTMVNSARRALHRLGGQ